MLKWAERGAKARRLYCCCLHDGHDGHDPHGHSLYRQTVNCSDTEFFVVAEYFESVADPIDA